MMNQSGKKEILQLQAVSVMVDLNPVTFYKTALVSWDLSQYTLNKPSDQKQLCR